MPDETTKSAVSEGATEQLNKTFEGFVEAMSFRSAQGMGTDRVLSEMVAEINARSGATYAHSSLHRVPPH